MARCTCVVWWFIRLMLGKQSNATRCVWCVYFEQTHWTSTQNSTAKRRGEERYSVIYWVHGIPGLIVAQITRTAILRKQLDWFMMVADRELRTLPYSLYGWGIMGRVLLLLYCLPWEIFLELIIYVHTVCVWKKYLYFFSLPLHDSDILCLF